MLQISYQVSFLYSEVVGSMPVMMSSSTFMSLNCVASAAMEPASMSVFTISAIAVTVLTMVAGSLAMSFLTTAMMTERWLAARYRSPSP